MFGFTQHDLPVPAPTRADIAPFTPTDVAFLPLWVAAAVTADENNFCEQYDRIARAIGGPDREALRDMGLLPTRTYDVRVTRTVRIYQDVTQYGSVTVNARDEDDAREQATSGDEDIYWDDDVSPDRYASFDIDDGDWDGDLEISYVEQA